MFNTKEGRNRPLKAPQLTKSRRTLAWLSMSLALAVVLPSTTSSNLYAQATGVITGNIIDNATGEPVVGAVAIIRNAGVYGQSDVGGNYRIDVPAGTHKLEIIIGGYKPKIYNITVAAGQTVKRNVVMGYEVTNVIKVTGKRVSSTSAALLVKRKKAATAQDSISAEQISKSPDSDAASAMRRVTGVTIVDGKFIYVRGLPERYTSILFNGSSLPSPDPDKRVVPLDVFPANLLDNLIVHKTYNPEMPGEFGGGMLELNTKDNPETTKVKVGISTGYHSLTTFKDFYSYNGGGLDFFGIEDGTRDAPSAIGNDKIKVFVPVIAEDGLTPDEVDALAKKFNKTWAPKKKTGILPGSINFTYGDSYNIGKESKLGVIASGLFKEKSKNKTTKLAEYSQQGQQQYDFTVKESTYETTKGGLLGLTYTLSPFNKFRYTTFFNQNTEDEVQRQTGCNTDLDAEIRANRLQYVSTNLWFNQLYGEHYLKWLGDSTVSWRAAYSQANRDEPDNRSYVYFNDENTDEFTLIANEQSLIRYYSEHTDTVIDLSPDFSIPFSQWNGLKSKLKLGGSYMTRERDADTRRFLFDGANLQANNPDILTGSIGSIVADANIDYDEGLRFKEITRTTDAYIGTHDVVGGFGLIDLPLIRDLRFIGGARYEHSEMKVTTVDISDPNNKVNAKIKSDDILPAANLVYKLTKEMQLRGSYSKTVARPDFKEMSPFQFTAIIGGEQLEGNENLTQTDIQNGDLRFEWFPSAGEVLSLSAFYKSLENPIEVVQKACSGTCLTFENADKATNFGGEFDMNKKLGFIWGGLDNFSIGGNFTYIQSEISLPSGGDYTNQERAMQGQSPYVINGRLGYDNEDWGSSFTVLYFIFGERIARVGLNGVDDTFEQPAGRLDFVYKQKFTEAANLKLTASNLLDPTTELKRDGRVLKSYKDGISFGLGFSYTFGGSATKDESAAGESKAGDGEAGKDGKPAEGQPGAGQPAAGATAPAAGQN